jgi:hypothetical protein
LNVKLYFLRNEAETKACEETTESASEKHDKDEALRESSSESHDIAATSSQDTERIVPLAPQEEDVDDDIIDSEETSR